MNRALCAAALSLLLSACAAVDKPVPVAANGGGSSTQYCWKDQLDASGDKLVCNWQPTAREACEMKYQTVIAKSAVASAPANAGRCENGQWLVKVTTR